MYVVATMARPSESVPFLDRILFSSPEFREPEQRYTKSLMLIVLLGAMTVQGFLALGTASTGQSALAVCHFVVAGLFGVVGYWGLRSRNPGPWMFVLVWALAWAASLVGLAMGSGFSTLLWFWFLPAAILVLQGTRWGIVVLVADSVVGAAGLVLYPPLWGRLPQIGLPPLVWALAWVLVAAILLVFAALIVGLLRSTLETFQTKHGSTLDLLSQTQSSEARWASQAMFQESLMDLIPFPVFHKGNDGRYQSANASFRVVFDVPKEQIIGNRNENFLRQENAVTLAKVKLDLWARDSMAVEEATLIHADGLPHDFVIYLMPFLNEAHEPQGVIGVLVDITERKLREQRLVESNSTKDQLFSIISHDLRGPVGKLKQLLDIYVDDPGIFNKSTWDQVFHDMRRSADSLFQLLENLLSWARSQQGENRVRFESVSVEVLVGDVFNVLKLLANDKNVRLEMNLSLKGPILADRHALATILRNLVHNALKFTQSGGAVVVTAEETLADLWIEVRDTGIGMSPDVLERLFKRHERFTTFGTGKEKGQGIGLGLCHDLAREMGAHLDATSSQGQGTAIRLHLPTPEL